MRNFLVLVMILLSNKAFAEEVPHVFYCRNYSVAVYVNRKADEPSAYIATYSPVYSSVSSDGVYRVDASWGRLWFLPVRNYKGRTIYKLREQSWGDTKGIECVRSETGWSSAAHGISILNDSGFRLGSPI